jgi:hypothetical protein
MHHQLAKSLATAAAITLAFSAEAALAQQVRYSRVLRYKVDPAKRAEFIDFMKTSAAKVTKELLKTDPKLVSWTVGELVYPGSPMPDYNFVTTHVWDGPPPEDFNERALAATRNAGFSMAEYQAKSRSIRTLTGIQLRRTIASASGSGGDYTVMSYYKAAPGRLGECLESLRMVSQPVQAALAKDGLIGGWGVGELVFPAGQNQPFDFAVSTSYKTLAAAIESAGRSQFQAYFGRVHTGQSYLNYWDSFRSSRTLVRRDLLHWFTRVVRE